ncbi:MAG TPA: surface-adhesin E family protein [Steroidobacteraceae bacterium]|nr:surface-adhesin E family protein [Steroidobacteraceae bacterium]
MRTPLSMTWIPAAAALLLASANALAGWTEVTRDPKHVIYVDLGTAQRTGDIVRLTQLHDFLEPRIWQGKAYQSLKAESEFNCKEEKSRGLSWATFTGHMGQGDTLNTGKSPDWKPVGPNTGDRAVLDLACQKTAPAKTPAKH